MFRVFVAICFFLVSGCSVAMTNQTSPLKLDGCAWWPVAVDSGLAVGAGVASVVGGTEQLIP